LREAKQAHDHLTGFMQEQIEERRKELRNGVSERDDVFTKLVQANEDEESRYKLADDELVSSFIK
jgi:cytochrome P450